VGNAIIAEKYVAAAKYGFTTTDFSCSAANSAVFADYALWTTCGASLWRRIFGFI
jgi:hypothetical protein